LDILIYVILILQTYILYIGIFNSAYPADTPMRVQFGTTWSQTTVVAAQQPLIDLSIPCQINDVIIIQGHNTG